MVVTMHVHFGLREIVVENQAKRAGERRLLRITEGDAEVLLDIPLRKQRQLAREERLVVAR